MFYETEFNCANQRAKKAEDEVARLRELLNRAIQIAERSINGACGEWSCIGQTDEVDKYGKELTKMKAEARLAPAPEEPSKPVEFEGIKNLKQK
jgi:hypothetical protein